MRRYLHTAPAATAMALVMAIGGFCFIVISLMAARMPAGVESSAAVRHGLNAMPNLLAGIQMVLVLSWAAGIAAWAFIYSFRRDGMHRLAMVETGESRASRLLKNYS
jgi:hypothetical protein